MRNHSRFIALLLGALVITQEAPVGASLRPPRAWSPLERLEWDAACIFFGTVTQIETIRTDPSMRVIRYRFRDVTFVRGGGDAREVKFETILPTPQSKWVTYKGRRGRIVPALEEPPVSFDRGARYLVLADGVSKGKRLVQVAQIAPDGVYKIVADSSGVMVLEGTTTSEQRFLQAFHGKREPPPPEPVPASP